MSNLVRDTKKKLQERNTEKSIVPVQYGDAKAFVDKEDIPYLKVGKEDYKLTDTAFRQLSESLEVPVPYAKRIDNDLFSHTFNYLMDRDKDQLKNGLVKDGVITTLSKPDLPFVPEIKVFETLENAFDGDYDLKYVRLTDTDMSFSILPHEYKNAIDGSNLFGGLKVIFSESWATYPSFDAYIWRELCTNGMIDKLEGHKFRVSGKNEDQILTQVEEYANLSLAKLPELFDNFEKLLEEKVDNARKTLAQICREYKLPNKVLERLYFWLEQPEFLATIRDGHVKNMHDIVNLLTYVGTHDMELSEEHRNTLLAIGGSVTQNHEERCNSCGATV